MYGHSCVRARPLDHAHACMFRAHASHHSLDVSTPVRVHVIVRSVNLLLSFTPGLQLAMLFGADVIGVCRLQIVRY